MIPLRERDTSLDASESGRDTRSASSGVVAASECSVLDLPVGRGVSMTGNFSRTSTRPTF